MKKRAIYVVVLAGCFLSPVTHAGQPSQDDAFVPAQKGDQWVYQTRNKKSKETFEMKVTIEEQGDDKPTIMTQRDKRGKMREFLVRYPNGVFISKLGLSKSYTPEVFTEFNPPVPKVIFPLTPGNKVHWEGG